MSLSQEDTLRIVRHFLLSSPPGEFEDVLSDIRELVQNDELLNKGAFEIFHTYNIEQLIPVDVVGKEHKVILSKYNEISETQYLDPISNSVITVDHTKGQVIKVEPAESENEEVSKKRAALQTAIDKYVADHYLSGLGTVYPVQNNSSEFIVCITASKFNEKNFWSGRWRSVYRISLEGENKAKVSGSMKVNVHYYESGNVQLNTSKEHGESISAGSFEEIATKSADVIRKAETNFHGDIDEQCTNLNETFKSLRRRLPLTKKPFDFTAAFQHKMTKEFTGK